MLKLFNSKSGKLLIFITLLCLSLLVIDIISGYYLRRSGDDFAFSDEVTGQDPINFMRVFLTTMAGRFTNGGLVYVMYQVPQLFIMITPFLFILLFILAAYLFIRHTTPINKPLPALLLSVFFTFSVTMVPVNQYQTIDWLPSYISYGLPLALLLMLFAYFKRATDNKINYPALCLLFLFAFLIGGLHELIAVIGCLFIVCAWCLFTINSLALKGFSIFSRSFLSKSVIYLVPCIGFFTAFLADYLMPATALRRNASLIQPEGKLEMLTHSWDYSVTLLQNTLMEPAVIFCFFVTLLTCLIAYKSKVISKPNIELHPFTFYMSFLALTIIPFLSLYITVLSARYGYGTPPPERTNFIFYFCLIFCTSLLGILLGSFATKLNKVAFSATTNTTVIMLLIVSSLSFYVYTEKTMSLSSTIKNHSVSFDAREKYIKEQVKAGHKDLLVPSLAIGDTPYPKGDATTFPNKQIAEYYKLNSLRAYGYPVY